MDEAEFLFLFKLALFSLSKRTPFAWLAVLGAVMAAASAVSLYASARLTPGVFRKFDTIQDYALSELGETKGFFGWVASLGFREKALGLFLAGMVLLCAGVYPFVVAASGN